MGRQAHGGERRDRWSRPWRKARSPPRGRPGRRAQLPRGDAGVRRVGEPRRVVRAARSDELLAQFEHRVTRKERKVFSKNVAKARAKTSLRALTRLTHMVDGEPRFRSVPPLLVPLGDLLAASDVAAGVEEYLRGLVRGYKGISRDQRRLIDSYRVVDM